MVSGGGWRTSVRSATVSALPEIAAEGEGLDDVPGDIAADVVEASSMQQPMLTALPGGGRLLSGEEILFAIADDLSRLLPDVPIGDPYRPVLQSLAHTWRPRSEVRSVRLVGLRSLGPDE